MRERGIGYSGSGRVRGTAASSGLCARVDMSVTAYVTLISDLMSKRLISRHMQTYVGTCTGSKAGMLLLRSPDDPLSGDASEEVDVGSLLR